MKLLRRDKLGRFVLLAVRSAKKPSIKKRQARKPPIKKQRARKLPVKKQSARKPSVRKQLARKPPVKEQLARKLPVKKQPVRKPSVRKQSARKPSVKKQLARKPPVKKQLARKLPVKKQPARKPSVKKQPARKTSVRKRPARKLSVKKQLARKLQIRKQPARKSPIKKQPDRKPSVRKQPARKPSVKKPAKKRAKRKAELPLIPERSREAEIVMQSKLLLLMDSISLLQGGLDMGMQTFIEQDGSVDGELRIGRLPDEWRTSGGLPELIATLSSAFTTFPVFDKDPPFGGGFWATFAVRFGPQNEAEAGELADLYKRFRGLFQMGTYPVPAWNSGPIQMAITGDTTGLRAMIQSLAAKRGLPPSSILIRFIWGPEWAHDSRVRPGHYKGEK